MRTISLRSAQWLPTLEFHNPVDVLSSENFLSNFNGSLGSALFSALVFTMVNFLSIVAISSHFESDPGLSRAWVSPTKDLIAQGVACLSSGLIGGGPIGGSLSRSLVSVILGATSYVSSISAGLTLLLLVNFVGGLLTFTPITSLAALVVCAVGVEVLLPKDLLKLGGAGNKVVGWWTGIVTMLYNPVIGFSLGIVGWLVVEGVEGVFGTRAEDVEEAKKKSYIKKLI